jgi:L-ascorbate metabolism protein UlaG (beta-lactamase superfamily)
VTRRVTYLGHATTLVELDGMRLLTDPVLRPRVAHLRRSGPAPVPLEADAILVSHGHLDHLDLRSLALLSRRTPVVCPWGLGHRLRARGFADVREVVAGELVELGPVRVETTHAEHGGRMLPGRDASPVGYLLAGSARVFFAGDTDLFPGMADLAPLDLALLPIWGWGPSIGPGHLDPTRAAEALTLLRPRLAVPIHWGTLRPFYRTRRAAYLREPADAFVTAARERAPGVVVHVLEPGSSLDF